MKFLAWLKRAVSHRGKAVAHYHAGIAKANKNNHQGAIADYSAAIEASRIPADVKAMAIYNRALSYSAIHNDNAAADDIAMLLKMPNVPENIKSAAKKRRERIRRRNESAES